MDIKILEKAIALRKTSENLETRLKRLKNGDVLCVRGATTWDIYDKKVKEKVISIIENRLKEIEEEIKNL